MRCGRKSKPVSDFDTYLSDEFRTVQGHIQNLTLVADEVIVEREPRSVLPRSSRLLDVRYAVALDLPRSRNQSSPAEKSIPHHVRNAMGRDG